MIQLVLSPSRSIIRKLFSLVCRLRSDVMAINVTNLDRWPALPVDEWADTYTTLHLWTQVVGKIRLALSPRMNHWWEVPLYVTARGLTTSPMPAGGRALEIAFDFVDHRLL